MWIGKGGKNNVKCFVVPINADHLQKITPWIKDKKIKRTNNFHTAARRLVLVLVLVLAHWRE